MEIKIGWEDVEKSVNEISTFSGTLQGFSKGCKVTVYVWLSRSTIAMKNFMLII